MEANVFCLIVTYFSLITALILGRLKNYCSVCGFRIRRIGKLYCHECFLRKAEERLKVRDNLYKVRKEVSTVHHGEQMVH